MNEINRKFRKSRGFGFVETLNGYVFTPEANAHTFRIQCVVQEDNLETVVPFETGSVVSARFLKSDHVTELVEGSLDENGAAVVTLPAECYAVPGRFLLTILVAYNSISVCVYAATGTVIGAESGTVNLSQNASREIDEKIAELNAAAAQVSSAISAGSAKITEINQAAAAARASIPQDYTALSDSVGDLKSAIAPNFSDTTAYLAGECVWYNGMLYRFTIDHAAGSWNGNNDTIKIPVSNDFLNFVNSVNCFTKTLTVTLKVGGTRTWALVDTGLEIGKNYYFQVATYSGANSITRIAVSFLDSSNNVLEIIGDHLVLGDVINFTVPQNSAKFRVKYYLSAEETSNARLSVNIWEYRFQSILDDLTSGLAAKVDGQTFGYIYRGNIAINTSDGTITTTDLRVVTSRGKYNAITDTTISYDKTKLVYIGYSANDDNFTLVAYPVYFTPTPDKVLLFGYQNGELYFTDQYDKITINGNKYNPINYKRTICCLGDSFTAGENSWPNQLRKQTSCRVVNLGVAGTRMTVTYTSNNVNYKCFIDRVAEGALDSYDPDLIVVFGGINDAVKLHNDQCRIGDITDTAEYSTSVTSGYSFIARVKYLIDLIKTKKPGVPILGVLPPDYSEGTNNYEWWYDYIGQIRNALQTVYEFYGIPYVNLEKDCQEMYIDDYNLTTYRINGLSNMHPSVAGATAIGKIIYTRGVRDLFYMDSN